MKRHFIHTVVVVIAVLFVVGAQVEAGETRTDAGHTMLVPVSSETVSLADGRSVVRTQGTGFVVAEDAASPLHMVSITCWFTDMNAADGSLIASNAYCDCIDKDGDAYSAWGHSDGEGGQWQIIPGSGKFKNAKGGGAYSTASTWGDGKSAVRWDAKWSR